MRMHVKTRRSIALTDYTPGVLLWHWHCPACHLVGCATNSPGFAHDDARRHAEKHGQCVRCYGYGLLLHGSEGAMTCPDCDGRGWV